MKNLSPEISIVIPAYNIATYLPQCLEALIHQTFSDFEVVIVNDGSTDATPQLCERYAEQDPRIRVIHQHNEGSSSARNRGYQATTGKYVAFLDGDDWAEPHLLRVLHRCAESTCSDVVIGKAKQYFQQSHRMGVEFDRKRWDLVPTSFFSRPFNARQFPGILRLNLELWRRLFRREFLDGINFSFRTEIQCGEDLIAHFEHLVNARRISLVDSTVYNYRKERPGQKTLFQNDDIFQRFDGYRHAFRILRERNATPEMWMMTLWQNLHTFNWLYNRLTNPELLEPVFNASRELFFEYPEDLRREFRLRYPNTPECFALICHERDWRDELERRRISFQKTGSRAARFSFRRRIVDFFSRAGTHRGGFSRAGTHGGGGTLGDHQYVSTGDSTRQVDLPPDWHQFAPDKQWESLNLVVPRSEQKELARVNKSDYCHELAVLRPGDVVLDIGAGCGLLAMLLALRQPEATVLAIEPDDEKFTAMNQSLSRAGIDNVIPIHGRLVPDQGGVAATNKSFRVKELIADHDIGAIRLLRFNHVPRTPTLLGEFAARVDLDYVTGVLPAQDSDLDALNHMSQSLPARSLWRTATGNESYWYEPNPATIPQELMSA